MKTTLALVVMVLTACGGSAEVDGGSGGEAPVGGGAGSSPSWTAADCSTDLARFEAAHCQDQHDYALAGSMFCPKVPTSSALCGAALSRAAACQAAFTQATLVCNALGATDSSDPCAVDVLLGVYCVASTNSTTCLGPACQYDSDCGAGSKCNDATHHCARSDGACLGLPCLYDVDCPTALKCNGALGQCVRR